MNKKISAIAIFVASTIAIALYFVPRLSSINHARKEISRRTGILSAREAMKYTPINKVNENLNSTTLYISGSDSGSAIELGDEQDQSLRRTAKQFLTCYSTGNYEDYLKLRIPSSRVPYSYRKDLVATYQGYLETYSKFNKKYKIPPDTQTSPEKCLQAMWGDFARIATIDRTTNRMFCTDCWHGVALNNVSVTLRIVPIIPRDIKNVIRPHAPTGGREWESTMVYTVEEADLPILVADVVMYIQTHQVEQFQPVAFSVRWDSHALVWIPFQACVGVNNVSARYLF